MSRGSAPRGTLSRASATLASITTIPEIELKTSAVLIRRSHVVESRMPDPVVAGATRLSKIHSGGGRS
jgi:hypothetical protein